MTNCETTYYYASSTLSYSTSTCFDTSTTTPIFTYGDIINSFFLFLIFCFLFFKTAYDFVNPSKTFQKYD